MHVVCTWTGNTEAVAAKYYLQVTDENFAKAVQNPVQSATIEPRTAAHGEKPNEENLVNTAMAVLPRFHRCAMRDSNKPLESGENDESTDASPQFVPREEIEPLLMTIIELWPELPGQIKNDIFECIQEFV